MKNLKKFFAITIYLVMLCLIISFNGVRVEAKEVPKYLKDNTDCIYKAYMYGDKAIARTHRGVLHYNKKVSNYCFDNEFWPTRISKKYVCTSDRADSKDVLINIEDGSKKDISESFNKMRNAIKDKYKVSFNEFGVTQFCESDTDQFWRIYDIYSGEKDILGVVSSNGDVIEFDFDDGDGYRVSMHDDKAYVLYSRSNQNIIDVYSPSKEKVELCKIDHKIDNKDELYFLRGLVFNKDSIYVQKEGVYVGKHEICKINLEGNKGNLTTILDYKYDIDNVAVDNNKNIWYIENGLIYKIENDKPVVKYEVQKNKTKLFVSDDNNLIASGDWDKQGKSTIINLSDKYTDGWVKEGAYWYYYIDRQCVSNQWKQIDGTWYCFNEYGQMLTGWISDDNNNWYYLNDNGSMVTGWKKIDGQWYYMNNNGSMATGWKQDDGAWYYLNDNGSMAKVWKKVGKSWYYFYNNGPMAHDTTIEGYKIGSNGSML